MTIPTYTTSGGPLSPANGYSDSNSWYNQRNARTCIGLTEDDKTLVLFTVDNAGGSNGMTVGEAANYMVSDLGVYNALNLDGGGSTTMAMQNPLTHVGSIVNASSDTTNTAGQGRLVGLNLAVFALHLLPGDANGDDTVDINDLTIVLAHYGQSGMTWSQGEFTGDGTVDINDLTIVLANYGATSGTGIKAAPEPSCVVLLGVGAIVSLAFAWRRRRPTA